MGGSYDFMCDFDFCFKTGRKAADTHMKNKVADTRNRLLRKVKQLEVRGRTALGPAVLTSVAMASKGAPGSQVIICTDGMANIGLGAFTESYDEVDEEAAAFYERVG